MPISRPPIRSGWVQILDNRIVGLGEGSPPSPAQDLGDVALLPGLVNAHTHLEFSDCQQPIGHAGTPLPEWIGQVVAARADSTAQQKAGAIKRGMEESARAGVTLIGEIATPPCDYPTDLETPDIHPFAEVLGLSDERSGERLRAADTLTAARDDAGVSPHAPYSTSKAAIAACLDLAIRRQRTVAMHVAESPAERELLINGSGPFATALKALGAWQAGLFPWSDRPVIDLIEQLSSAPRVLMIHGNDLTDLEIGHLSRYPHLSVVYCPRTHAFFRYDPHPVDRLLTAGVRVALGTDSRASNPDLDVWKEVQHLLKHRIDLDPQAVLAMATRQAPNALGRLDLGRIEFGSRALLGTVRSTPPTSMLCLRI